MTPRAYCGDACRDVTRASAIRFLSCGNSMPYGHRYYHHANRAYILRSVKGFRADRVRLARIGCCIGCGQTSAERASELAATGGVR